MLRKTLLFSIAQLIAIGTAISLPSIALDDGNVEADRAEVAGILLSKTGDSGDCYYVFVISEYNGPEFVRQHFCDNYTTRQEDLLEGVCY